MNNDTFYIVYSPNTIRLQALDFSWSVEQLPDYMRKGYYITAIPFEPWNIKFKGTLGKCINVLRSIDTFVYN